MVKILKINHFFTFRLMLNRFNLLLFDSQCKTIFLKKFNMQLMLLFKR